MKTNEQTTLDKARELNNLADEWVNKTFNYIQVDVLNKCCDNMLFEYIRPEELDLSEFLNNYSLWDEYEEYLKENELEDIEDNRDDFCKDHSSFDDWRAERENENYPMWNTCFEFRYEPTEEILNACINAGFGVIEGMEDFNTLLFVAGAGYSFYGQHWIPAFLNMPWNSNLKENYKGVNYSMM